MTIARAHLIDPAVTRWYHCVTRCVRRAFLLGEGPNERKVWIDNRLRELADIFSIAVGGFSVMDNHLHVLARLDPEVAAGWSDEEVVRRWGRLFPPRDKSRLPLPVSNDWGNYLLLVDYTGRLFREGKAAISREVAAIFERIGTTAETWQARLEKLSKGRLFGRFFAASRQRLREVAERLGLHRVPNLGGCPAT